MPPASSKGSGEKKSAAGELAARLSPLAEELDALRARERGLELDLSYASIDRAEDRLAAVVVAGNEGEVARWRRVLSYYLGATLVEHAGGRWALGGKSVPAPRLSVTGFGGAAKAEFDPEGLVARYVQTPAFGMLRDATERFDLPLRRKQVAAMVAERDARLAALRADIKTLIGKDPGVLDGGKASVAAVEEALRQPAARKTSRELRRRMIDNSTLYLGLVLEKATKRKGTWTVADDVGNADFGEAEVLDWQPITAVRSCVPSRKPGALCRLVDAAIEERER